MYGNKKYNPSSNHVFATFDVLHSLHKKKMKMRRLFYNFNIKYCGTKQLLFIKIEKIVNGAHFNLKISKGTKNHFQHQYFLFTQHLLAH